MKYLNIVKLHSESAAMSLWRLVVNDMAYHTLMPLFEIFCVPVTLALVKHIFSHREKILCPHHARLGDKMLVT